MAAALLAACATPQREPAGAAWTTGRMSVRIAATPAQIAQSMTASFELRGDGDSGELRLNSPFGSRVALARWAPGEATLATSEGERRFTDLDELSRAALGEALPLAALSSWLSGRAWPGAAHSASEGGFEQLGWQVGTSRFGEGSVEARRLAPPEVVVRVKLDGAG